MNSVETNFENYVSSESEIIISSKVVILFKESTVLIVNWFGILVGDISMLLRLLTLLLFIELNDDCEPKAWSHLSFSDKCGFKGVSLSDCEMFSSLTSSDVSELPTFGFSCSRANLKKNIFIYFLLNKWGLFTFGVGK